MSSLIDLNPSTLNELVDALEIVFSQEALDDMRDCPGLGELPSLDRFIRKNLVLRNGNRYALFADCGQEASHDIAQLAILRLRERLRAG